MEDFEKRNAQLAIIGNGKPEHIGPFRKITGYRGILLTDPELKTYKALNFKKSMGSLIGIKSATALMKSVGSGYTSSSVQGNAFQQGGALVVGPGDTVHYVYRSKEAGDEPPVEKMLKACEA